MSAEDDDCPLCDGRGELQAITARGEQDSVGCPWCIERDLRADLAAARGEARGRADMQFALDDAERALALVSKAWRAAERALGEALDAGIREGLALAAEAARSALHRLIPASDGTAFVLPGDAGRVVAAVEAVAARHAGPAPKSDPALIQPTVCRVASNSADPAGPGRAGSLCEDCPPVSYPTDKTRCAPCPRRALTEQEPT